MKKIVIISLCFSIFFAACGKEEPTIVVEKNDETYLPSKIRPVLDKWQKNTFQYFYQGACPTSGMALEGTERGNVITTGGSGFGIMSLIVGSERAWISREQAAGQMRKIVRFLGKAERFKGIWSHWYTPDGLSSPFGDQVKTGDAVESAFLMVGLLAAMEYFAGNSSVEKEVRDSVASFWNTMNWKHYTDGKNVIKWLWHSQENRFELDIRGWNESWIVYILAMAAPDPHKVSTQVYEQGWKNNQSMIHLGRKFYGYELPLGEDYGGPLFFSHYSFLGLDPHQLQDNDVDYWKQNLSHTLINRHYCLEAAPKTYRYDERNWGLTACYGGKPPWEYSARSPLNDDGVIAPTAALSAYPYTPFYSTQVLLNLDSQGYIHGVYGFADAYAPAEKTSEKRHLAIDQGPIVVMIENYRSGLLWNLLMKNEHILEGLKQAGIKKNPDYIPGFHRALEDTRTGKYDMIRHPDRGNFELDYYLPQECPVQFVLYDSKTEPVIEQSMQGNVGENLFSFDSDKIRNGESYILTMKTSYDMNYSITICLH